MVWSGRAPGSSRQIFRGFQSEHQKFRSQAHRGRELQRPNSADGSSPELKIELRIVENTLELGLGTM